MARLRALLLAFVLAFAFLGAGGPKPCLGNGAGQACSAAACACTLTCSCQGAHEAERSEAAPWRLSHCGGSDRPVWRDGALALAACHGEPGAQHFGYGQEAGPALGVVGGPAWPALALAPPEGRAVQGPAALVWPLTPPPPKA